MIKGNVATVWLGTPPRKVRRELGKADRKLKRRLEALMSNLFAQESLYQKAKEKGLPTENFEKNMVEIRTKFDRLNKEQ